MMSGTGGSTTIGSGGTGIVPSGTGGNGLGTGGNDSGIGGSSGSGGMTTGMGGRTSTVDAGTDAASDVPLLDGGADSVATLDTGDGGGMDGSTVPPCPASPPRKGDPCDGVTQCFYEDCAGAGRTAATCTEGAWSVDVAACNTFICQTGIARTTCPAGTVCIAIASGVPVTQCVQNACGSGPISCSCLSSSCIGTCSVRGTTEAGVTIDCNPCAPGGCV